MEVVLLGTGSPRSDPDRRGAATLVRVAGKSFLVDCGSGVTQRLVQAGAGLADVDAVFLTHLHSDHIMDFYQMVQIAWQEGREREQRIFGPRGTRAFVDGSMKLWEAERNLRIAHEKRPSTTAFEMSVTEVGPGTIWNEGGVHVRAVANLHMPVKHSFGFVFEANGFKVVLSGDTTYCPALVEAARGASLLVHECFMPDELTHAPPAIVTQGVSYHSVPSDVGRVAHEANVELLAINHFVPVTFDRAKLVDEVAQHFEGPIVVGEDLMRYDCVSRRLQGASVVRIPKGWR